MGISQSGDLSAEAGRRREGAHPEEGGSGVCWEVKTAAQPNAYPKGTVELEYLEAI